MSNPEPFSTGDFFNDGTGFVDDFGDEGGAWLATEELTVQLEGEDVSGFIRIPAGSGKNLYFTVLDKNGDKIDLTGAQAEWVLAQSLSDDSVRKKTEADGITFPALGQALVQITPDDTIDLSGRYVQEFNVKVGGETLPVFLGIVEIAGSPAGEMG